MASAGEFAIVFVIGALGRVALQDTDHVGSFLGHVSDDAVIEGRTFEAVDADDAPAGLNHPIHEKRLVRVVGLELGDESSVEVILFRSA